MFTYLLILFAQYVVLTVIIIPEENLFYKTVNLIIFELLAFLALTSHLRTMLTDPVLYHPLTKPFINLISIEFVFDFNSQRYIEY